MFQGNTDVGDTTASAVFAATVDIDPGAGVVLAGVLAYNGGPVKTIALNTAAANPAIDAGDDDDAGVPATDARGVARTDSGSPDGDGDITDLGAFEVTREFVVTTLDDVVDHGDGLTSLREAIALANGAPAPTRSLSMQASTAPSGSTAATGRAARSAAHFRSLRPSPSMAAGASSSRAMSTTTMSRPVARATSPTSSPYGRPPSWPSDFRFAP